MPERTTRRGRIQDDRGKRVESFSPQNAAGLPKDSPQAELVRRLARNDYMFGRPAVTLMMIAMMVVFVVGVIVAQRLGLPRWVEEAGRIIMVVAAMALGARLFWSGAARQIAATAVRRGLCGSCGYSLEALAPEADGCVCCPECGAAWRPERMTRPYWRYAEFAEREEKPRWWRSGGPHRFAEDDRGALAEVLNWRTLTDSPNVTSDQRAAIRRDLRARGRASRHVLSALMIVPAAFLVLGALSTGDGFFVVVGLALAAITGLGVWTVQRGLGHVSRREFCQALKLHGVLPCCGEPMDAEPDESGCVTCRRCGAGWRKPTTTAPQHGANHESR